MTSLDSEALEKALDRIKVALERDNGAFAIADLRVIWQAAKVALSASKPNEAEGVKVKALEWAESIRDEWGYSLRADASFGSYEVGVIGKDWHWTGPMTNHVGVASEADAIAAAQADYTARIRSALTPAQTEPVAFVNRDHVQRLLSGDYPSEQATLFRERPFPEMTHDHFPALYLGPPFPQEGVSEAATIKRCAEIARGAREGNTMLDNEPPLFVKGYETACADIAAALAAIGRKM